MEDRKDFNELLAEEEFQYGISLFDSYDRQQKRAFLERYSIRTEEFVKARAIISGLSFKEKAFSEKELDYLWQDLNISKTGNKFQISDYSLKAFNWFSRVAAILFVPLLIAAIWFNLKKGELQSKANEFELLANAVNTVSAPIGGRTTAVLPDGSEVLLNSGSSIQYPVVGNKDYREVKLSGEGFFKVRKDPGKPMFVDIPGMRIKVYGTTFNIRSYEDEPIIETVLVEGKISIIQHNPAHPERKIEHYLKPGELGKLNKIDNDLIVAKVDNMDVFTGWVAGKYVFKNWKFSEILQRLQRLYNVQFVLQDETIGDFNLDATFENQSIDQIMEILSISLPIKWEKIKKTESHENSISSHIIKISKAI
jgi:ferric-dicitrate binding protein FerR (iron transport regulator)